MLVHIIGIQENHTYAYVTLHHGELYQFESTMVFFPPYFGFCIFFSHVLIIYAAVVVVSVRLVSNSIVYRTLLIHPKSQELTPLAD